jgi:purine-binding chemotaxis protein CheW
MFKHTTSKQNQPGMSELQVSTFYVGKYFFGIEVMRVQEVLRSQKMTTVPLAPPVIEGLINLRGQIVPALDMRRRLHLEPRPAGMVPMNVIVRTEEGAVSLIVDDIGDVLDLDPQNIEQPPENLTADASEIIHSVYKLKDSLLLLLDADKTIDVSLSIHTGS